MKFEAILYALTGDQGAYASHVPPWLNFLCGYLDYGWFFALLGWTLVLIFWWWHARNAVAAAWRWVPVSATAGLLTTIVAFIDLTAARLGTSPREAFIWGDRAMTGIMLLAVTGWWLQVARDSGRFVRALCTVAAALPIGLFAWFVSLLPQRTMELPMIGTLMVGLAVTAAIPWWFKRSATAWSRVAITLAALTPLISTVSPLSRRILFMGERFSPLSPLGVAAAGFQVLVAAIVLAGVVRVSLAAIAPPARRGLWREVRPFIGGALACVALGLGMALLVGHRQRQSAGERALDQARLAATQIDPAMFAAMVGPAFRLDTWAHGARHYFPPTRLAFSKFLAGGGEARAKQVFLPIARASRTMTHLRFVTLRGGWLVGMTGYSAFAGSSLADAFGGTSIDPKTRLRRWSNGYVLLGRRPSAEDLIAWSSKTEWLEGPLSTPVFTSSVIFARAPIVTRERRMLGWLEFTYQADAFLAESIQARVAPFVGATLGVVLTSLLFVQRRHSREREVALRAAAVAAEANRVKTDFLAKVSHELRTPLQSITGYGELLESEVASETGRVRLTALRQQSELMLRLVDDLLDLSAIEAGVFRFIERPVALAALVDQAVESLRPRALEKGLALQCTIAPEIPPWVVGDAVRLRQILLNLVGNAVKFTERGGAVVELRVIGNRTDPLPGLAASAPNHGPGVRAMIDLTVRDTGPGIAPAEQPKLFQSFARLELTAAKEGSGLGLALVAGLCRSAGGAINVESDGRSGSCFHVRLPLTLAEAPTETEIPRLASLRDRRVLIADDNALVRELFASYLTARGAICEQVADGEEALTRALLTRYDAIVLDLAMPRLGGLEVARRLRAADSRAANLHIVGVSAHAAPAHRAQALAAGMNAFLLKPVELTTLAAALALEASAPFPAGPHAALQARLSTLFRADAANQAATVTAAIARRDWPAVNARAHHLKNSAAVVRDEQLYSACTAVEDAADRADEIGAHAAWSMCAAALRPWLLSVD